jgi:hypothetical protein
MGESRTKGEEAFVVALRAIDSQIQRELLRSPQQREEKGLSRKAPQDRRVENLTGFLLETFSKDEIGLDGLIVSARGFVKALTVLFEEYGEKNLGSARGRNALESLGELYNDLYKSAALRDSVKSGRESDEVH